MSLKHFILIFCAGGAGALSRFGLTVAVNKLAGGPSPWGTLVVNMLGCFLFGFLWAYIGSRALPDPARIILLVGFVGSFTTFSSFIFDSFLLSDSRLSLALANIVFQNIVGLACLVLGIKALKMF
jgi:Integral membrane protein possibly involved in chromosome condensation